MAGTHPDELDLLAYVDGETSDRSVAEHVAGCPACAGQVRRLEAGRDALRASALLELPEHRRQAILAGLPRREPRRSISRRRLLTVLAPVAVVAGLVAVATNIERGPGLGGGGDDEAAVAEPAAGEAPSPRVMEEAEGTEAQGQSKADTTALRSVAGTPEGVASYLRQRGFKARAVESTVEVRGARRARLLKVLEGRPEGHVVVLLK
jgi:anti-sigma factor RsiW